MLRKINVFVTFPFSVVHVVLEAAFQQHSKLQDVLISVSFKILDSNEIKF